jgi:hypothetical protein
LQGRDMVVRLRNHFKRARAGNLDRFGQVLPPNRRRKPSQQGLVRRLAILDKPEHVDWTGRPGS